MTDRKIHLHPEPVADDPSAVRWRIGPGLVRFTRDLAAGEVPAPVQRLYDDAVLTEVSVAPGRIVTRLAPGHTAAADGAALRSALFEVLSAPGGWPVPGSEEETADADLVSAADREIAVAVEEVLAGEFGSYTGSHGGLVELLDVHDGTVRVVLSGRCHGCAYADNTIRNNLQARLAPIPGFRGVVVAGDHDCRTAPVPDGSAAAPSSVRRRVAMGLPRIRRSLNKNGG
ncbi:MAG: NifU family protein [Gordonia sp. (in: high G+C Gram-positive bacteria)]|uniref:NifU family protein n=1 Tax=Gordonia sp. (in: high G+C Gram-positive bacteria) TaxID=84139 RepID=UPI0039E310CC